MLKLIKKDLEYSLLERERFAEELSIPKNSILLKTCNRVEVYSGCGDIPKGIAEHLFRITSGLESAMLGESAVQGQVKDAYLEAHSNSKLSKALHFLFQRALKVGKRVRSETKISNGAMTHSHAVIEILKMKEIDISKSRILIIGASNLNESVLKHLIKYGNQTTLISSRNNNKALELGKKYRCPVVEFKDIAKILDDIDIIITATSAPHFILKEADFRACKGIIIFDLAFPRDVDPKIGKRKNVELLNISDIEQLLEDNQKKRQKEKANAERIISEELALIYE